MCVIKYIHLFTLACFKLSHFVCVWGGVSESRVGLWGVWCFLHGGVNEMFVKVIVVWVDVWRRVVGVCV